MLDFLCIKLRIMDQNMAVYYLNCSKFTIKINSLVVSLNDFYSSIGACKVRRVSWP